MTKSTRCRLYILQSGLCTVNNLEIFAEADSHVYQHRKKKLSIACFLIAHPNGWLLWDTGLPDDLINAPKGLDVLGGDLNFSVEKTLISQLEEIGITPQEVNYLTFSHMHYDHIGNSNLFASATFLIDATEYDAAFNAKMQHAFFFRYYNELENSKTVKIAGRYDLFGDGSVVLLPAPGHSPGHRVLYINLPETGPVVISGDLYHFTEQRVHKRVPRINFNREQTLNSMQSIEAFIAEKNAQLIISHDYEQIVSLPRSPDYLE